MILLSLMAVRCEDDDQGLALVDSIAVTPATVIQRVDSTYQLTAVAYDVDGQSINDVDFTWTTTNAQVATVSQTGLISALSIGGTNIQAAAENVTSNLCVVTVVESVDLDAIDTIVVVPTEVSLAIDSTYQLSAEVLDANGAVVPDVMVAWTTTDASVASVNQAGMVMAVSMGQAVIWAGAGDVVSNSCEVTAFGALDLIVVTPFEAAVRIDSSFQLTATAYDADGGRIPDFTFTWSSSDELVAVVSSSGLVTGVTMGAASIRAAADEVESNFCDITVLGAPQTVAISQPAQAVTVGGTQTVSARVFDGLGQVIPVEGLIWTAADETKITLSQIVPESTLDLDTWTANVTGLARGVTSITAGYGAVESDPINVYVMAPVFTESFNVTDTSAISQGHFTGDVLWQVNHDLEGGEKTGKATIVDDGGNNVLRMTDASTAYFSNRQLLLMTYGYTVYDAGLGWPDTTTMLTGQNWRCEFSMKGMDDPALNTTAESLVMFTQYYESGDNPYYLVFAPGRNRVSAWIGATPAPGATIPAWGSMPEIKYDTWFNAVVEVFEGTMRAEVYTGTEPSGQWDYTYTIPNYPDPEEYIPGLWLGAFLVDTLYVDNIEYSTP